MWQVEIDDFLTVGSYMPMSEAEARTHYAEVLDREHEMGLHGAVSLLHDGVLVHETCSSCRCEYHRTTGACRCDGEILYAALMAQ